MSETVSQDYSQESEHLTGESVRERSVRLNRARRRLFVHALIVGLMTGLLGVVFRYALEHGETIRRELIEIVRENNSALAPVYFFVPPFLLVGFALWVVLRYCPEAAGSGIPHLRLLLRENGALDWRRVIPVKFLSGLLAIMGGLCLGREGPTIQMGAGLGAMWGDGLLGKSADRRTLLVTGARAGLTAAFNAPFAGILFVMEELRINIPDSAFFTAMISCVAADLVSRSLLGQEPILHATLTEIPSLMSLPFFLILGVLCGLTSWAYNKSLIYFTRQLAFQGWKANTLKVAVTALTLAVVAWTYPTLLGGGIELSNLALLGEGSIRWLCVIFALRFVMSIGSYAIGTAGGIFAPLLVLGGLLGLVVGQLARSAFPDVVPEPTAFALVGMAALFAGVVRCPLTGIMLIVEMTGIYGLIIPLMVASFAAAITADQLQVSPVYDGLLESQLASKQMKPTTKS